MQNPDWETGRISSLQAGLRNIDNAEGALILPVDTVGIRPMTIELLLQYADTKPALAVRPVNAGKPGKILWISRQLFSDILAIKPNGELRFDDWIADKSVELDVDDPAIHHNVNTPEAWAAVKTSAFAKPTVDKQLSTSNSQLPTFKEDTFGDG